MPRWFRPVAVLKLETTKYATYAEVGHLCDAGAGAQRNHKMILRGTPVFREWQ